MEPTRDELEYLFKGTVRDVGGKTNQSLRENQSDMMALKEVNDTDKERIDLLEDSTRQQTGDNTKTTVPSINLIYFAQVANVVGSGALTRDIAATVGDSSDSVWYTQTLAIFTAILGIPVSQAADLWGRKIFLVILTTCGFIGSLIIAGANSPCLTITGFAVTGISYGAQPLLHAIVSEVFARKYRPWAQSSVNVAASLGAIMGLLVGGAVTRNENHVGFRVYWYIVAGLYAVATISVQLLYSPPPRALQLVFSFHEKLRRLDWLGYGFLTPALVLFCMSLTWIQNPYSWTDAHVSVTFTTSLCFTVGLVAYETMVKRDGMFHHRLFKDRNFPLALGCIFVEGMVFFCANDYFAFQVSMFFSQDSLITGAHYSVAFAALGISAILSGLWCSKTKAVRVPTIAAFSSFVVFNILMATMSKETTSSQIWTFLIFLGLGLGICLPSLVTAAHFATPQELVAITSGLMISLRSLGGSVGLAVYSAVFHHGFSSSLGPQIAGAVLPLGFPNKELPQLISAFVSNNETAIKLIDGISPEIIEAGHEGLLEAYRVGFRGVWVTTASISFVAIIVASFLRNPTDNFTAEVDAPIVIVTEAQEEMQGSAVTLARMS
ncbi:unnamed protein product [Fusarium graminearum]|uniref:Major facilitator superfamily (MFS) profile domain-containing protein n=1 Tax=Gibberella zeae TaxID=5518 RepID=A0A9N8WYS6_GIBZA|nr:unnamed protein product [Fusarium graminearum]